MEDRRAEDPRIAQIVATQQRMSERQAQTALDINTLQVQMAENTVVTVQVRDLLASFKTFATMSKWVAAVAGSLAGVWAVVKGVK